MCNINEQKTLYLIQYLLDHVETFHKSYVQYIQAFYKIVWCYGDYEGDYGNLNLWKKWKIQYTIIFHVEIMKIPP